MTTMGQYAPATTACSAKPVFSQTGGTYEGLLISAPTDTTIFNAAGLITTSAQTMATLPPYGGRNLCKRSLSLIPAGPRGRARLRYSRSPTGEYPFQRWHWLSCWPQACFMVVAEVAGAREAAPQPAP